VRVHFDHVSNHVTGNYSPRQLPVTDETIRAMPRVKWSPDGRYLTVIVARSTEALQVVLVSADGRALRTVSPNSQYLWGDVEWSPDARRIAYIVATGPYGSRPDLFVTDLGADRVTRVTTGSRLSGTTWSDSTPRVSDCTSPSGLGLPRTVSTGLPVSPRWT
jgi:Tol biopolymer transport system component